MSEAQTPNRQLVKKLTAAAIIGDVLALVKERNPNAKKGHSILLFDIYGSASGIRSGTSNYGDWTMFTGSFEAVNLDTGEVFNGPQCALPEPALSMLRHQLSEHDNVQFAFRLGVKITNPDLKAATDYEYTVQPIVPPSEDDALSALRQQVQGFALPAPAADKAKAKSKAA